MVCFILLQLKETVLSEQRLMKQMKQSDSQLCSLEAEELIKKKDKVINIIIDIDLV